MKQTRSMCATKTRKSNVPITTKKIEGAESELKQLQTACSKTLYRCLRPE